MRQALVAVAAVLVAGCAADGAQVSDLAAGPSVMVVSGGIPPSIVRFASGDHEASAVFEATYQPTDVCFPTCQGAADQVFDLTSLIPADAPVELSASIDGNVFGVFEFTDADAVQSSQEADEEGDGGGGAPSELSALVVRGESGTVKLHLMHIGFPPDPAPETATAEVRAVVRSELLVPGIPASIRLAPGDELNLTGSGIAQMAVLTPRGEVVRDTVAPFTFLLDANGTAGDYTVIVDGDEAVRVLGPNTTMAARRIVVTEGERHALTPGQEASWTFQVDSTPLMAGLVVTTGPTLVEFVGVSYLGAFQVALTSPGNVDLLDEQPDCGQPPFPFCEPPFLFNHYQYGFVTPFLDEHLLPGSYSASVTIEQGQNVEAFEFVLTLA